MPRTQCLLASAAMLVAAIPLAAQPPAGQRHRRCGRCAGALAAAALSRGRLGRKWNRRDEHRRGR